MSQHRIIGSEAFERQPCVHVHTFRPGTLHRRGSTLMAFVAGAGVAAVLGVGAAILAFAPGAGL
jgi:hypothetical protein